MVPQNINSDILKAIAEETVRDYITYYNNTRIQTKINNQSPIQYRQLAK